MEREGNGRAAMNDENLIRSLQIVLSSVSVGGPYVHVRTKDVYYVSRPQSPSGALVLFNANQFAPTTGLCLRS